MAPRDMNPLRIYLNNAATTWPKPPEVLEEVAACLCLLVHETGRRTGNGSKDYPVKTREALAAFFRAEKPEHFIFTQNATDALILLVHAFVKKAGTPVHASTTEPDHNTVLRPLTALEQNQKITLSIVPFSGTRVTPATIKKAIRPGIRLLVMIHGSNVLGSVHDIQPVAEYLAANDIFFIVDGGQTASHVPVDLSDLPAGAFAYTGHKALFGITGIVGFYIRDIGAVAVTRQGGTGTDSQNLSHPPTMPQRFETGTSDFLGIASLYAGIRYISKTGMERIGERETSLCRAFIRELRQIADVFLYNDAPELPLVVFNIGSISNQEAGFILARAYNLFTRTGLHRAPLVHRRIDGGEGCIRASFSYFNTREHGEAAAVAVREVAASAGR